MSDRALSPDTDRRFVELALSRALVDPESVRLVAQRRRPGDPTGRSMAELLCEAGALDRTVAAALLREVRGQGPAPPTRSGPTPSGSLVASQTSVPGRRIDPATLGPGSRLGSYRIVSQLGRGGMGVVFRAYDERLRREVALKLMHDSSDRDAADRFVREARAAAKLHHPGIVAVHDAGVESGVPYMALELVLGTTLAERLARGGPLTPERAATLVRDLALAVQAAHDAGVIHRDLKPANVLLEPGAADGADERARLTDFGLARDSEATAITASGATLGTPAYMAPEQAMSQAGAIGPRTDVYGLGAVLYAVLAGRPPFEGSSGMVVMSKVVTEDPASPSSVRVARGLAPVPRELELVCQKCLEKDPDGRYPTATALAAELGRYLAGEPVAVRPLGALARGLRRLRRSRGLQALALVLAAAVATGGTSVAVLLRREDQARAEAHRQRLEKLDLVRAEAVAAIASFREVAASVTYDDRPTGAGGHLSDVAIARGMRALLAAIDYETSRDTAGVSAGPDDPDAVAVALAVNDVAYVLDSWEVAESVLQAVARRAAGRASASRVSEALRRASSDVEWGRSPEKGLRARLFQDRAGSLRTWGRWGEMIEQMNEAIALDTSPPRLAELRASRAFALLNLHDSPAALRDCEAALRIQPRFPGALSMRSSCRLDGHDNEGALEDAAFALRLKPDLFTAQKSHAQALLALRRFDEGLAELATLVREGHREALFPAIDCEIGREHLDAALRLSEDAVQLFPLSGQASDVRGRVRELKRDLGGARADFERAVELDPTMDLGWLDLGECLEQQGDSPGAVRSYRRFLALVPRGTIADQIRARVAKLERTAR